MRKINLTRDGFVFIALILVVVVLLLIWTNDIDMDKMVTIEAGTTNKGEIDYSQINYGDIRSPTAIVFEYEGKVIGQLEWGSGEFQFVGEADQSAMVFFDYFLKPYIDTYIDDELRRRKE